MNPLLPLRALVGALLLTLPLAAAARGELITVEFLGTVTDVFVIQDPSPFDFPDVGEPFTGYYTFDSTTPDGALSAGQGIFLTVLPDTALAVSVGDFQFKGSGNGIVTSRFHYSISDIEPFELTSNPPFEQIYRYANFRLVIGRDNLLADPNVLPLSPPSLDGAVERYLRLDMYGPGLSPLPYVSIVASLESLTVVPEPSSWLLLGIASILSLQNRIVP
jgi:hypothetical protein